MLWHTGFGNRKSFKEEGLRTRKEKRENCFDVFKIHDWTPNLLCLVVDLIVLNADSL